MARETSEQAALPGDHETTDLERSGKAKAAVPTERRRVEGLREAFRCAVERLEQIIDLETEALQQHSPADLQAFNHKKSHGLLEMTRAMRALEPFPSDQESLASLERLRGKLGKNLLVLETHLKAVRQISGIIARAIEADESDGTYSARAFKSVAKS